MASSIYTTSLFLIILTFVLSFRVSSLSVHRKNSPAHKLMKEKHERWISEHGRKYKDEAEKERRFKIFKENVERIEAFNRNETKGMKLGVNHFADLTDEEFRSSVRSTGYNRSLEISSKSSSVKTIFFGDYGRRPSYGSFMYANVENVPESVDWRYKGAVTPVKQQGECGCCYTFSSIAAVEGINAIKRGQLISLSEQELVDCDHSNHQCSGGFMTHSFNFIEHNGITTEQNYPYRDNPGYFCLPAANMPVVRISGYQKVPANSEADMLKVVANQPLSIAISSDDYTFRFYKSGVLTEPCSTNLNHAVTIVGYGVANNGLKYWIIKNSWGTNWGEGGFGYLLRDSEDPAGICGIAMHPSFPII